jgi:hypothetical protein
MSDICVTEPSTMYVASLCGEMYCVDQVLSVVHISAVEILVTYFFSVTLVA